MAKELVDALLLLAKFCMIQNNCKTCPLKDYCGKTPSEW